MRGVRKQITAHLTRNYLAGFGTVPMLQGLPRFHRAFPSTALDECILHCSIVDNDIPEWHDVMLNVSIS
jgi:hypothetical protein